MPPETGYMKAYVHHWDLWRGFPERRGTKTTPAFYSVGGEGDVIVSLKWKGDFRRFRLPYLDNTYWSGGKEHFRPSTITGPGKYIRRVHEGTRRSWTVLVYWNKQLFVGTKVSVSFEHAVDQQFGPHLPEVIQPLRVGKSHLFFVLLSKRNLPIPFSQIKCGQIGGLPYFMQKLRNLQRRQSDYALASYNGISFCIL